VMTTETIPLEWRIENALLAYIRYMGNLFWPTRLAAYYPYSKGIPEEKVVASVFVLIVISALAVTFLRRRPFLAVGWIWFLVTLVPVIGLVQVGGQSRADRYTYLPLIGLFIVIAWTAGELVDGRRRRRMVAVAVAAAALAACLILTAPQVKLWRDSETLFRHTLAVTTDNALAHVDLGFILAAQDGRIDEAMEHFAEAVRIRPNYVEGRNNLGLMLAVKGRLDEAIEQYRLALATNPRLTRTHSLLGSALNQQGKKREAFAEYQAALDLEPDHLFALNDLAWMLATDPDPQMRNGARAVELAERAVRVTDSRSPQLIGTLAAAYAEAGRFADAVKTAEKAAATATAAGEPDLAARNREMLEVYRAGKAYHEGQEGTERRTSNVELPTSNRKAEP
jgi:hypothetical protein